MATWKGRAQLPATSETLSTATEARLHKLVLRACRHGYGAEAALRSAVRFGVTEMLEVGASREAIRNAITDCVVKHPGSLPDKPSLVTGASRSEALLERMLEWTNDVSPASEVLAAR